MTYVKSPLKIIRSNIIMSYYCSDVTVGAADEKQLQPQQQQQLQQISSLPLEPQQQQQQQQKQVCAGCNLGPFSSIIKKKEYDDDDDTDDDTTTTVEVIIPLKSCSRCNQVFYHNILCQKKHYNQHKDFCRYYSSQITMTTTTTTTPMTMTTPATTTTKKKTIPLITKQQQLDQNNSFQNIVTKPPDTTGTTAITFSKEEIQLGYRIVGPNKNNNKNNNNNDVIDMNKGQRMISTKLYKTNNIICQTIYPCISPILSKVHRSVRCSICFCAIKVSSTTKSNNNNNAHYLSKHPKYIVIVCDGCYKNTESSSSSSSSSSNDKKDNNKNSKNNKYSTTSIQQQQQQQQPPKNNIQWLYDEIYIIQKLLYNLGEYHPIIILPNSILLYRLFLFCYTSITNENMIFDLVNSISGNNTTTNNDSTLTTTTAKQQQQQQQQQQRLLPDDWLIFQDRCFFIVIELLKLHPTIKDQLQYWFENISVMKSQILLLKSNNNYNNTNYLTWYLRELLHRLLVNQFSITSFLSLDFNEYELTDELLDRVVGTNSNNSGNDREFFEDIGNTLYQNPGNRINHSCVHNAKQQFSFYNGLGQYPTLQLIATQTILPNEEINISYISTDTNDENNNENDNTNVSSSSSSSSYTNRQKSLQTYYGFTCTCSLCLSEKGNLKKGK